jgi:hypothetical protein
MIGKVDFNVTFFYSRKFTFDHNEKGLVSHLPNSTMSRLDEGLGLVARLKI